MMLFGFGGRPRVGKDCHGIFSYYTGLAGLAGLGSSAFFWLYSRYYYSIGMVNKYLCHEKRLK